LPKAAAFFFFTTWEIPNCVLRGVGRRGGCPTVREGANMAEETASLTVGLSPASVDAKHQTDARFLTT